VNQQWVSWQVGQDRILEEKFPNWRHAIERGNPATTTRVVAEQGVTFVPGEYHYLLRCLPSNSTAHYQLFGDLSEFDSDITTQPAPLVLTISSKAEAQALQNFIGSARQAVGSFKGATFLAELNDVIRGIRNPARGIRDLLDTYHTKARRNARKAARGASLPRNGNEWRDFERRNPRRARDVNRALSDSWLEYQFGALPLGNDVADAIDSGVRLYHRPPRVRVNGYGSEVSSGSGLGTRNTGDILVQFETIVSSACSVKFCGAVKLNACSPASSMRQEFGLTTNDFLPAVWEAIPFSFLVDYFTNVGNIVEAWSFPHSSIVYASRTVRWENSRDMSRFSYRMANSTATIRRELVSFVPSSFKTWRKQVHRTPYTGSWVPSLRFEIPGTKNYKKWLNMGALASLRLL
jgi:hypothetical protein